MTSEPEFTAPYEETSIDTFAPTSLDQTIVSLDPITATSELVHCPECGHVATVNPHSRDCADFCRNCDYPLFWAVTRVVALSRNSQDESLRRLPGTVGRVTVASLACPHCAEPNPVTGMNCVRCGLSLAPLPAPPPMIEAPPPPTPVLIAAPAPLSWIWIALMVAAFVILVGIAAAARYWLR